MKSLKFQTKMWMWKNTVNVCKTVFLVVSLKNIHHLKSYWCLDLRHILRSWHSHKAHILPALLGPLFLTVIHENSRNDYRSFSKQTKLLFQYDRTLWETWFIVRKKLGWQVILAQRNDNWLLTNTLLVYSFLSLCKIVLEECEWRMAWHDALFHETSLWLGFNQISHQKTKKK